MSTSGHGMVPHSVCEEPALIRSRNTDISVMEYTVAEQLQQCIWQHCIMCKVCHGSMRYVETNWEGRL